MANFTESERHVLGLFKKGAFLTHRGRKLQVLFSEKPTCHKGEPKTDVFIRCKDCVDNSIEDIKISYKQINADFIENKMKAERAQEIFGVGWAEIIKGATKSLKSSFERRTLVYKVSEGRTEAGAITLGWKFELLNKCSGELAGDMALTEEQKMDVFAGRNLDIEKKNAQVNGETIRDSGVANFMLVSDSVNNAQDVIDNMIPIEEYARNSRVYFAWKALNYRSLNNPPKWDGNRPLSVQVDWSVCDGRLVPELDFDHPLVRKGNEIGENLKSLLRRLGVSNTNQLTIQNCSCL